MKYVLRYAMASDVDFARVRALFPEHRQHTGMCFVPSARSWRSGPWKIRLRERLPSREAAEQFARSDPFVTGGVVGNWDVTGWQEAILEPLSDPESR